MFVTGNVLDNTTAKYSIKTPYNVNGTVPDVSNNTDAILVLPGANNPQGERSNFRLKIGGNADMLHTQDSGYYDPATNPVGPLEYGYLYRDAGFPTGLGSNFPTVQTPIWLSGGGMTPFTYIDEVAGLNWGYIHPRENKTLTDQPSADKTKWMPYASTDASVYGVGGLYSGGTDIHTRTASDNDTTSIIEIGRTTNNQNHFKIYSSGMLKNFRAPLDNRCDSLVLGGVAGIPAPGFYLSNDTVPLYIINDGNGAFCCNAGIKFNKTAVDSVNQAIARAAGGGDLHIQATSFIKFYGSSLDFNHFKSATPKENEIKILSDNNVIYVENDLNFTKADTAHLTVWAKGPADANRGYSDLLCGSGAIHK